MIPQLKSASYVNGYRLRLEFTDGAEGEVDLEEAEAAAQAEQPESLPVAAPEEFEDVDVDASAFGEEDGASSLL